MAEFKGKEMKNVFCLPFPDPLQFAAAALEGLRILGFHEDRCEQEILLRFSPTPF